MDGGNYVRGKRGMSLVAEAMEQLQIRAFLQQCDIQMFDGMSDRITQLQLLIEDSIKNQEHISEIWNVCMSKLVSFEKAFAEFKVK